MRDRMVVCLGLALASMLAAEHARASVKDHVDTYWHYRDRLTSEFLVLGEEQGLSLPASDKWKREQSTILSWADCTTFHGWYIAALATEHYLLSHPERFPNFARGRSRARQDVERELYLALSALRRLDRWAESTFEKGHPDVPGFFIRDDVLRDDEHGDDIRRLFPGQPYDFVLSDFMAADHRDKEMSQDQVIHLLFGLAFVHQLVPGDLVVEGMPIRQEASAIAIDMVEIMTDRRFDCCEPGSSCSAWVIRNPVSKRKVKRGASAGRMAPGINKAVNFLTDDRINFGHLISEWGWARWYDLRLFMYLQNADNLHMTMALAAISNGWDRDGERRTLKDLMSYAGEHGWYLYPLANAVLQPKVVTRLPYWGDYQKSLVGHVRPMLDSAPWQGPYQECAPEHRGWCCPQRFLRERTEQNQGLEHFRGTQRSFNGLDYMLLHNLYYIAIEQMWEDPGAGGAAGAIAGESSAARDADDGEAIGAPADGDAEGASAGGEASEAADGAAADGDATAGGTGGDAADGTGSDAADGAAADGDATAGGAGDEAADGTGSDAADGAAEDGDATAGGAAGDAADGADGDAPEGGALCSALLGPDADCEPGDATLVDEACSEEAFSEPCGFCERMCDRLLSCAAGYSSEPRDMLPGCLLDCVDMNIEAIRPRARQASSCAADALGDCARMRDCFLPDDPEIDVDAGAGCQTGGRGSALASLALLGLLLIARRRSLV
ncbi:MAG: hypothetical protein JXR96_05365 [Deltaproteobacteria bacterium]|nr:hypothetical protein [Deltaproteobacteria bacterium]